MSASRVFMMLPAPTTVRSIPAAARPVPEIREFKSNGCSLFPDGEYFGCCFVHDFAYWAGGTFDERRTADRLMRNCIMEVSTGRTRAIFMWGMARIFGFPDLPTGFRWGHGWPFAHRTNYSELLPPEREQVEDTRRGICQGLTHDAARGVYLFEGDKIIRLREYQRFCPVGGS
jgi:hypothetical protein